MFRTITFSASVLGPVDAVVEGFWAWAIVDAVVTERECESATTILATSGAGTAKVVAAVNPNPYMGQR